VWHSYPLGCPILSPQDLKELEKRRRAALRRRRPIIIVKYRRNRW